MNTEQLRDQLEAEVRAASDALKQFPRSSKFGLTPDSAKNTPEGQSARREFMRAFTRYRTFNQLYPRPRKSATR